MIRFLIDCNWQDKIVADWAAGHPAQVKRGESATEWIALEKEHGEEVRKRIKNTTERGQQTWDYINKNFEILNNGDKNQVKK